MRFTEETPIVPIILESLMDSYPIPGITMTLCYTNTVVEKKVSSLSIVQSQSSKSQLPQ